MEKELFPKKISVKNYKIVSLVLAIILVVLIAGGFYFWQTGWLVFQFPKEKKVAIEEKKEENFEKIKEEILTEFEGKSPQKWGEKIEGIKTSLIGNKKILALTLDAPAGDFDEKLINFLKENKIPATLFISGKWIEKNLETFKELAKDPLFEIENLGLNHRPCSANGKEAYGIEGTKNVREIIEEIELNSQKIEEITGRKPKYFRPGTGFADEICLAIAEKLGYQVVNYSLIGDEGATLTKERIKEKLIKAEPGSIIILHMNQPKARGKITGQTAEGFIEAYPILKEKGFEFVKLEGNQLK